MSLQYMKPAELVTRSMIAMSDVMGFVVTDGERTVAHDLDRRVVGRIRETHPDLSLNGWGGAGWILTREQLEASRNKMTGDYSLGEFRRAMAFLLLCCGRRKSINRKVSSYGLKHSAERVMRDLNVAQYYVSNGAFITAAIALGYKVERIEGTPNCFFDVTVVRESER